MNPTVKAALDADLATLQRVAAVPQPPLGYGRDWATPTVLDVTPDFREVDPMSPAAIGDALLRRLVTQRGALWDDPDYGWDIRGRLNTGMTQAELDTVARQVRAECTKDPRVSDVIVTVTFVDHALSVALRVVPLPPTETFDLVFGVDGPDILIERGM